MTNFTKGKWVFFEQLGEVAAVHEDAEYIHTCLTPITGQLLRRDCREEMMANGRLIAAAPEMYNLLKRFAECRHEDNMFDLMENAQELIACIDNEEAEHEG